MNKKIIHLGIVFISIQLLFIDSMSSQRLSLDLSAGVQASNGFAESNIPVASFPDFVYKPKPGWQVGIQLNIKGNGLVNYFTGLEYSMYRYHPVNAPRWGSQYDGPGSFRDIGFDENGLVENYFIGIPFGFEGELQMGEKAIYPHMYGRVNYSISNSPLISLEQVVNPLFFTAGAGVTIDVLSIYNSSISINPYCEVKPYYKLTDHAYSNEKIWTAGLRVKVKLRRKRNIEEVIE